METTDHLILLKENLIREREGKHKMKAYFKTETVYKPVTKVHLTSLAIQKLLGLLMFALGIAEMFLLPEDATAGLFMIIVGIARMISNYTESD